MAVNTLISKLRLREICAALDLREKHGVEEIGIPAKSIDDLNFC